MGYFLADKTSTYHFDQVGSTAALTAQDGSTVTDRFEYSPYGVLTHRTGDTDTPFQYNGRYGVMTDDNGLLHMRAVTTTPAFGRFINQDPIGFDGGLNWYAYANNSPLLYVDPDGEHPIVALALAGTAAYLGSTQFANAPGPNDPTFNGAPFADEVALLSGAGVTASASRGLAGGITAFVRQAGDEALLLARAGARQTRQLGQASYNQANLSAFRANQALLNPSPVVRSGMKLGVYGSAAVGFTNEVRQLGFNTTGMQGVDFGSSPVGATLQMGITAFDAGGALGKWYNAGQSYWSNSIGNRSTPSYSRPSYGNLNSRANPFK
jgi:RHS repeat-associated protein